MEELKLLQEYYIDRETFSEEMLNYINENYYTLYNRVIEDTTEDEIFYKDIIQAIAFSIYEYYKRDKVLYKEKALFSERLFFDLSINIPKYVVKFNLTKLFEDFRTKEKYDDTSTMDTSTKERGLSASGVVQSSASTPTGINLEDTGANIIITKEEGETNIGHQSDVQIDDDAYATKYTNYQSKTNGVHDNDLKRDSKHTRKGGLKEIITFSMMLPQTLFEDVLKDVSKHFVFVY